MKGRNSSFELLRIIAMLMIILHHLVVHGLLNNALVPVNITMGARGNNFFCLFFLPGGEVGVALFFMITGFFCINSDRIHLKKIVSEIIFYAWLTTSLYFIIRHYNEEYLRILPLSIAKDYILKAVFFPIRSGTFWFGTSYVILRLFLPVYNPFLKKLNKKGFLVLMFFLLIVFMQAQLLNVWLGFTKALFFYTIGAFIKMYCTRDVVYREEKKWLVGGISLLISFFFWFLYTIVKFKIHELPNLIFFRILVAFTNSLLTSCILVTACSICIFYFFNNLHIGEIKLINKLAATTFGVYLIHDSRFIRPFLWCNIIKVQNMYFVSYFPYLAILSAIFIFCFCSLFDYLRLRFIEPVYINFLDKGIQKFNVKTIEENE